MQAGCPENLEEGRFGFWRQVDETHEGYDYGANKIDESGDCATDVAPYADQATQQHFRN